MIDRALDRYLSENKDSPRSLVKAMRYGVFSGGKRFRPILALAAGELFGCKPNLVLPFACALELIHAYSLIHDDLPALDNDDTRRGEPASHRVFGEGMALLAGDALLTEAFRVISRPEVARALKPSLVLRLNREIAQAAGAAGMVGGQATDLEVEAHAGGLAAVEDMHARKTGALILAAARVGASIGGASPSELRRVSRYAALLGLAFQIADDISDDDREGHAKPTAETNGVRKKITYPSIVGVAAARARLQDLVRRSLKELDGFGEEADPLRAIARSVGAHAA
jgi:geranylgeranyl diphosphate synthase type II